jgi:hypothetical protein
MGKDGTKKSARPSEGVLNTDDVVKLIKEAEKGPFYTSAEVKEHLKKWKRKRA